MKKEILLFTGWGATSDVWKLIIPALCDCYQVNCHTPSWLSESTMSSSLQDFDQYIDEIATSLENSKYVLAWSMGGLLAIALAKRYPSLVEKICFISSVPNFVAQGDQFAGINFNWYQAFVQQYQQQALRTLKKFLTLQVNGDEFAKGTLLEMKNLFPFEKFDLTECGYGLELLSKLSLRSELMNLDCDTIFIHGQQDAVVNPQAVQHAAMTTNSPLYWIENAGHVPQLSHSQDVLSIINKVFK